MRKPRLRKVLSRLAHSFVLVSFESSIRSKFSFASKFSSGREPARRPWFPAAACLSTLCFCAAGVSSTESAIANGDTRIIRLYHAHTGESIEIAYRVNGQYDPAALEKLNWFLRDWRRGEATRMDPRLFDAVWETYRAAGAAQPITVVCGYRSPQTNSMLRARSRGVAEHSQHILGRAMDTTMPGMSMEKVREVAMRLQMGGVGYYAGSNFVHIDVGGVRSWPRMSYDQLARLFPDGKTVHIASNGQTLPRYEEARAELQARGSIDVPPSQGADLLAWLFSFGHGDEEREDALVAASAPAAPAVRLASRSRADAESQARDDGRAAASQSDRSDRTIVASLSQSRSARQAAEMDSASEAAYAPLPPSRPTELVALLDAPMPPTRPGLVPSPVAPASLTLAANNVPAPPKKDPIGNLIATTDGVAASHAANLPDLITQGSNAPEPAPADVLAYAGSAQIEGLRSAARNKKAGLPIRAAVITQTPPPLVPARLDHANFLAMTGSVEVARLPTQTVLGATVTGLRQVAQNQLRLQAGSLSNVAVAAIPSRFALAANDLPTDRFVNPAAAAYASAAPSGEHVHVVMGSLALKSGD